MIRLKTVRFHHAVPAPGLPANHHSAQTQWQASGTVEIQTEGAWVAIFAKGAPLPRLVPTVAVDFAEPVETPKGFAWTFKADEAVA
jgi:hypothetical protein